MQAAHATALRNQFKSPGDPRRYARTDAQEVRNADVRSALRGDLPQCRFWHFWYSAWLILPSLSVSQLLKFCASQLLGSASVLLT